MKPVLSRLPTPGKSGKARQCKCPLMYSYFRTLVPLCIVGTGTEPSHWRLFKDTYTNRQTNKQNRSAFTFGTVLWLRTVSDSLTHISIWIHLLISISISSSSFPPSLHMGSLGDTHRHTVSMEMSQPAMREWVPNEHLQITVYTFSPSPRTRLTINFIKFVMWWKEKWRKEEQWIRNSENSNKIGN